MRGFMSTVLNESAANPSMEAATKRIGKANTHHRMRLAIYGDYGYTMGRRMIYTLQQICASLQGGGVMAAAAARPKQAKHCWQRWLI